MNIEQHEKIMALGDKADVIYKAETGFTPREHFHRTSAILTTREDRNRARRRYNQIIIELEAN